MRRAAIIAALLFALPVTAGGPAYTGYTGYTGAYGPAGGNATAPVPNLIPDSWQFESAAWSGTTAAVTVFPNQASVLGDGHASIMKNNGAGPPSAAWYQETQTNGILMNQGTQYTFSAYYKRVASAATITGELRLYNITVPSFINAKYSINTSGVMTLGTASTGVTPALVSLGDGWYRLSGSFTISGLGLGWAEGNSVRIQMMLWDGSIDTTMFLQIAGVQINAGLAASAYQEKP